MSHSFRTSSFIARHPHVRLDFDRQWLTWCSFRNRTTQRAWVYTFAMILHAMRVALGDPNGISLSVLEVTVKPTERFAAISDLPKGPADTGAAVIGALLKGPLFTFKSWASEVI